MTLTKSEKNIARQAVISKRANKTEISHFLLKYNRHPRTLLQSKKSFLIKLRRTTHASHNDLVIALKLLRREFRLIQALNEWILIPHLFELCTGPSWPRNILKKMAADIPGQLEGLSGALTEPYQPQVASMKFLNAVSMLAISEENEDKAEKSLQEFFKVIKLHSSGTRSVYSSRIELENIAIFFQDHALQHFKYFADSPAGLHEMQTATDNLQDKLTSITLQMKADDFITSQDAEALKKSIDDHSAGIRKAFAQGLLMKAVDIDDKELKDLHYRAMETLDLISGLSLSPCRLKLKSEIFSRSRKKTRNYIYCTELVWIYLHATFRLRETDMYLRSLGSFHKIIHSDSGKWAKAQFRDKKVKNFFDGLYILGINVFSPAKRSEERTLIEQELGHHSGMIKDKWGMSSTKKLREIKLIRKLMNNGKVSLTDKSLHLNIVAIQKYLNDKTSSSLTSGDLSMRAMTAVGTWEHGAISILESHIGGGVGCQVTIDVIKIISLAVGFPIPFLKASGELDVSITGDIYRCWVLSPLRTSLDKERPSTVGLSLMTGLATSTQISITGTVGAEVSFKSLINLTDLKEPLKPLTDVISFGVDISLSQNFVGKAHLAFAFDQTPHYVSQTKEIGTLIHNERQRQRPKRLVLSNTDKAGGSFITLVRFSAVSKTTFKIGAAAGINTPSSKKKAYTKFEAKAALKYAPSFTLATARTQYTVQSLIKTDQESHGPDAMTQKTHIIYKELGFQNLTKIDGGINLGVTQQLDKQSQGTGDKEVTTTSGLKKSNLLEKKKVGGWNIAGAKGQKFLKKFYVNHINYHSSVICWDRQTKKLTKGSGYIVGHSLNIDSFASFWTYRRQLIEKVFSREGVKALKEGQDLSSGLLREGVADNLLSSLNGGARLGGAFAFDLAKTLGVGISEIFWFLARTGAITRDVAMNPIYSKITKDAVFIEASFAAPTSMTGSGLNLDSTHFKKIKIISKSTTMNLSGWEEYLRNRHQAGDLSLQSIRIRFRKKASRNKDNEIGLCIPLYVASLTPRLMRINNVSVGGMLDLAIQWYDGAEGGNFPIPPAILAY